MEEKFTDILDKNEQIIKVYKPNKTKLYVSSMLSYFFSAIWLLIMVIVGFESSKAKLVPALIATGVFLFVSLIVMFFIRLYYNNVFYAYSNKRIIVRKGIIGVDYKSLDMSMIGAVNVNVSVLDKILRKNTGTITFGSMASPMAQNSNVGFYRFANVELPYEKYKEIKSVIDEYKENKK